MLFKRKNISTTLSDERFADIERFLSDNLPLADEPSSDTCTLAEKPEAPFGAAPKPAQRCAARREATAGRGAVLFKSTAEAARPSELDRVVGMIDESFSEMLLRKIDESGMTDAECYKRALVDRKHFSKIRSDASYRPRKTTAIAFAIALRLDLDETRELLTKAGFALSHSSKFDLIVEYFISKKIYDMTEINAALLAFDQVPIGA